MESAIAGLISLGGILVTALITAYVTRRRDSGESMGKQQDRQSQNIWTFVEQLQEEGIREVGRRQKLEERVDTLTRELEESRGREQRVLFENEQLRRRVAVLEGQASMGLDGGVGK